MAKPERCRARTSPGLDLSVSCICIASCSTGSRRDDCGVDTNQPSIEGHQCTARVAGIDRRVGLDEIFVAFDVQPTTPQRADDAGCHGLAKAKRVSDRQYVVAHSQPVAVAQIKRGQIVGLDLEQSDIRAGITADQLCIELPPVLERHDDPFAVLHDVVVGQHISFVGIENHTGACAHLAARLRLLRKRLHVEKSSKKGIVEQWVQFGSSPTFNRNVDDG